jgi:thioesterase domain-containing protein
MESAQAALEAGKRKAEQQRRIDEAKAKGKKRRSKKLAGEARSQNFKGSPQPAHLVKTLQRLWKIWNAGLQAIEPGLSVAVWDGKHRDMPTSKQIEKLIEMYDAEVVEIGLRYFIGNWELIMSRYYKNKPRSSPTIGFMYRCHESLFREAQVWHKHMKQVTAWNQWVQDNPDAYDPPSELSYGYEQACAALKDLGFTV